MRTDVRHVVMYAIEQCGDRPNGRTYIQKLCFFVSKLLGQEMGFRAHYYGPYSDDVAGELSFLSGAGLIEETRRGSGTPGARGWEIARFDYSLTEQGRTALERLAAREPAEAASVRAAIRRVLDAGDQNYVELSFAAKTRWILELEGSPMTYDSISRAASRFNWKVSGIDVQKAADFLQRLELVAIAAP